MDRVINLGAYERHFSFVYILIAASKGMDIPPVRPFDIVRTEFSRFDIFVASCLMDAPPARASHTLITMTSTQTMGNTPPIYQTQNGVEGPKPDELKDRLHGFLDQFSVGYMQQLDQFLNLNPSSNLDRAIFLDGCRTFYNFDTARQINQAISNNLASQGLPP